MLTTASPNYFHNLQAGSPVLTGLAGSLISVLDGCLVDGWGSQTAAITVASGIATVTTPLAHVFDLSQIVLVDGATPVGLNGRKRVLTRSATTVTFLATGVADGAATGSITVKLAPSGWAKTFTGTNKAVYRAPVTSGGTRMFLRVDDSVGVDARVVGYEVMGDVDTGTGVFPDASQISGGGFWPKSNAATSAAKSWTVIADDRTVYFNTGTANANSLAGSIWGFGDFSSYKTADAYGAFLNCPISTDAAATTTNNASLEYCAAGTGSRSYFPRSFTGIGGPIAGFHSPETYVVNANIASGGGYGTVTTYPNGPNNGLMLSRKNVGEINICYRGTTRGMYVTPQNCHASFTRNNIIEGSGDLAGRQLLAVKCGGSAQTVSAGVVFFDITGPW
jgi:hypothetical protein